MFGRAVNRLCHRLFSLRLGLSPLGLLCGGLFFAAAIGPSLIPRVGVLQGALGGLAWAAGYGTGNLLVLLWRFMGLPLPPLHWRARLGDALRLASVLVIALALWQSFRQQERLLAVMSLPPIESVRPAIILAVAFAVGLTLLLAARAFGVVVRSVAGRLDRVLPPRVAMAGGVVVAYLLFSFIGNDLLMRSAISSFDSAYRVLDAAIADDAARPTDPLATGSPASLLDWEGIGSQGRAHVSYPLDAAAIEGISGRAAMEPLRIYVGLGSADTPEERAALALAEAIRVGAFERGTLVIASPTGTGWIDPAGIFPLEVLTGGDVATIAVQYSYLPSWLSLLTVPEYGARTAQAVFTAIHEHWRSLPAEARPRLYLFGLSLGALNSDLSAGFYDLVAAPYDGAFWVGPPFVTPSWRRITADRQPDSPAWLPRFRDGATVRFLNQFEAPDAGAAWGPMRIVILQYASDPITFFDPSILWRRPQWMESPRGPDVLEDFTWFPVVTFLQTGFDVITATHAPPGHGHVYAGRDYLRGWLSLMSPEGWEAEGLARLEAAMAARGL